MSILPAESYGEIGPLAWLRARRNGAVLKALVAAEGREDTAESTADVEPVRSAAAALRVSHLWKVFAAEKTGAPIRAVRGLNLQVHEGEITCLLGPNGAGKSTFVPPLFLFSSLLKSL